MFCVLSQNFCVLSQNFCVPSRNFAFSRKTFAFSRKDICIPSQNLKKKKYLREKAKVLRGNANIFARERKSFARERKTFEKYFFLPPWIFSTHSDFFPPQCPLKGSVKMGHWAQNESFTIAVSVLWPEPYRKWVRWTEEKKHRHGAVNLKDLERFCMKKWSLISYQVFSKVFRHYMRKLRAVVLGKGRCNNWVPIIVANMK